MGTEVLKTIKVAKKQKYLNVALPTAWVSLIDPQRGDTLVFRQTEDLKLVIELEKKG